MTRNQPITEEAANRIYDALIEHAGAYRVPENECDLSRDSFVSYAAEGSWTEFRFQGALAFGGKVWNNAGRWYVNCYPEDRNETRKAIIEKTNSALAALFEETFGEDPQRH